MIAYPLETTLGKSLLDQIESEALNGEVVEALRLCKTLGGKSSSTEVREWPSLELRGYGPEDDLPSYRRISLHPRRLRRFRACRSMTIRHQRERRTMPAAKDHQCWWWPCRFSQWVPKRRPMSWIPVE